ncbi:antibiotic biosynthesis monooxygenase [Mycolicibacterium frederiksbergense]|uniref:antibiotic biosynthesis monooxygenase n=1 Tax=Mycolicibacterium frederiksbergense TaxID=117567 RepID=UPI00265C6AA9|nr:antibiotic biosynthesis monooxygenase [Mycolicibacterium frederiksbergense]MDO0973219.1 antibiotic biosynthesis monooxygenase [Mycolicibacterium frederiksbergense]
MIAPEVTAVLVFHPGGNGEFAEWANTLTATAVGCVRARVSVAEGSLEPAVAVTFTGATELDAWLDRADALGNGGWLPAAPAILLTPDAPPPVGVAAFRHQLVAGRTAEFLQSQRELATAAHGFSGYEGTVVFVDEGEALSVLRFRTDRHLTAWMSSRQREDALPGLRSSLSAEFAPVTGTTAFGTTVRTDGGRMLMTPNWKSVMLVLLVLYPTVMLLSRFLGPVLDRLGAEPWLSLWLSQVISVTAMQWWLMPWASRPFRRWLDPVDGAGWRSSLAGAAVILLLYTVTLLLFGSVTWLQFWDYASP